MNTSVNGSMNYISISWMIGFVTYVKSLDNYYNVQVVVYDHFIRNGMLFSCLFDMLVEAYLLFRLEGGDVLTVQKEKLTLFLSS